MLDYKMKTFLTLCRLMNYRKTAEELNLTQPAVTQHIHSLEEYYGCKLFHYDRRQLSMTKEAQMLRFSAENIRYQEQKLMERLRGAEVRELRIGATKTIGDYVIGGDIANFLKEPRNRISITVDNTAALLAMVEAGTLDFALIEGNFDQKEFASRLYRSEPYVGICAADHPFAGRAVGIEELVKEPLILREEGSGTRKIFESILWNYNLTPAVFPKVTCVSSFGLITELLERRCGVTFAYATVKEHNPKLASFRLEGIEVTHDFNYVYLQNPEAEEQVNFFEQKIGRGIG